MEQVKLPPRGRFGKKIYLILLTISFLWILMGQFLLVSHRKETISTNHTLSDDVIPPTRIAEASEYFLEYNKTRNTSDNRVSSREIRFQIHDPSYQQLKFQKSLKNVQTFNCTAMSNLEKSINEKLTTAPQEQHVSYSLMSYQRNETDKHQKMFRSAFQILSSLMQTQHWPGLPLLLGACIINKQKYDVTMNKVKPEAVSQFKYVIEEPGFSFPLCRQEVSDDCQSFKSLTRFLEILPKSVPAALKIMRGVAEVFENFYLQGAVVTGMALSDVIVTNDYQIMFTSVQSLVFLDNIVTNHGRNSHKRLLSGMTCRLSSDCPLFKSKQRQDITKHCVEFQGHCSSNHRCWGVDASSYLCYLSRTLFAKLFEFVKFKWKHGNDLTNLESILQCASQSIPEHRCDWSTLKNVIDEVIKANK